MTNRKKQTAKERRTLQAERVKKVMAEIKEKDIRKPIYISTHNKKLKPTKEIGWIIFNIPSIYTCPNATNACVESCYAVTAEIVYPACLPSRVRNLLHTYDDSFVIDMIKIIENKLKRGRKKLYIVRIHESGDFYGEKYVEKWIEIAEHFRNDKRVVFQAYTKSFRFFDGVTLPKNFRLRASVWDDTTKKDLDSIERNEWPIYTAVEHFQTGDSFTRCRCSDCATCKKCIQNYKDIRCQIH